MEFLVTGFLFDRMERVANVVDFSKIARTSEMFVYRSFAYRKWHFPVSDGECEQYTAPRTCYTRKHLLACGSSGAHASQSALFCVIPKKNHPHRRSSCRTLAAHCLTAYLFLCRTALRLHSTLQTGDTCAGQVKTYPVGIRSYAAQKENEAKKAEFSSAAATRGAKSHHRKAT